jgi:nucleoside transporter
MDNPGKQFPGVRVLGTIGWIVANNVIGWLGYTLTVEQLYVGAAASLMLGLYSFTLPHMPPKKEKKASFKELIGLDALSLFKNRAFATIMIASVLIFIPVSFYFGFTASFMADIGIDTDIIPNRISMGQMAEILFILILPFFITRFGVKRVLFIGITAWLIRFLLFANGDAESGIWMIYTGIILHGVCYDFFVVTGQIFVDEKAPSHLKSSAQGLITFATYGLGMLIGTWFAGRTIDSLTVGGVSDWVRIWYVPTVIAAAVLVIFIFLFREKKKAAQ